MPTKIFQSWAIWFVRGVVALLFGIVALVSPFATLASLVILAATFMLVDGMFAFFSVFRRQKTGRLGWSSLFESLAGIVFGLLLLLWPQIGLLTFLYVLAGWSVLSGIFEIITAIRMRNEIENEWTLGLAGFASIMFGMAIVIFPGVGMIATSWMLAVYAICFGILMINTGTNIKREQQKDKVSPLGAPKPMQYQ